MVVPFPSHWSNRRLSCSPPWRASTSPQHMAWKRDSGSRVSSPRSLALSPTQSHSFQTTRPWLHSHTTTSTMHVPSTLTCSTTGSDGVVEEGALHLVYCPMDNMVTDTLIKALPSPKVKHFTTCLGLHVKWEGVLSAAHLCTHLCLHVCPVLFCSCWLL